VNGWFAGMEVIKMDPPTVPLGGMSMTVSTSDGAAVCCEGAAGIELNGLMRVVILPA
jgi:hypothetical protein